MTMIAMKKAMKALVLQNLQILRKFLIKIVKKVMKKTA